MLTILLQKLYKGEMKVKNRVLYLSTLFLLTLCISTKVEAKKIYVQKDMVYSLNQFSKKR